ncbi:cation-transporting P-type ATPase [Amycolatopsis sp. NPDC006131]|uniref:cation-transporting P-type ATPase n=1 Tax=Amycolatopsis sp. NPDC006131 TaxID=3156731 RepID=UPI0033ABAD08
MTHVGEHVTAVAPPYAQPAEDVAAALGTDLTRGLSSAEARARLERMGPNALSAARGPGPVRRFVRQIHSPLIYILLCAAAVTTVFGGYVDAGVIGAVVQLNAIIGYVQESRAQRALDALARLVPAEVTVVRDGATSRLPARDLVPGDEWRSPRGTGCPRTPGCGRRTRSKPTSPPSPASPFRCPRRRAR